MKATTVAAVAQRTIESCLRKQFRRRARPYKLLLELSEDCNSCCKTCAIWKTPANFKAWQMTLGHIERLFSHSGRDIVWLALSGGEITLYSDFPKVIELAKKYCPFLRLVTFTTNGLLPETALKWAQVVRGAGFDGFITVSLDGDADTHDAIRGVEGNHQLAWDTYNLLKSHDIVVHFGITVSQWNEGFVRDNYERLRDEIRAVTFLHGDGIYRQSNLPDDDSIIRSIRTIESLYSVSGPGDFLEKIYLGLGLIFLQHHRSKNTIPCSVGHASLHVRPNGTTMLCMYMPPIGNVKDGLSLSEMVNSPESKQLLARIDKDRCPHCWMNCYAPHSVLMSPWKSIFHYLTSRVMAPDRSNETAAQIANNHSFGDPTRPEGSNSRNTRPPKTLMAESNSQSFRLPLIQEVTTADSPNPCVDRGE